MHFDMGEMILKSKKDLAERKAFVQHLINDVKALELLLSEKKFEDDIVRIGAEQELCLIDKNYQPAGVNLKLLKAIDDPHFTTELASYNIEINLDPFELKGNCFSTVEQQVRALLQKADAAADKMGVRLLLAGILPTISKREVSLDFLTPIPRYFALNDALVANKGGDFKLKIRGVDELYLKHNSVLFEACNTSFQLHLQVPSHDFISSYNWSQAIAGPVLSICCNSPMLMGRELWKETRIALFQQSLDTRKSGYVLNDQAPRVGFGTHWEQGSVAEIFKKDVSKHRVLLTKPITEGSLEQMERGEAPKLEALRLHNGTVYRWNRPCYGIGGGKPHLRIENRYIPSGPSVTDEMANFAFWIGLMKGRPATYDNMASHMDFKAAKTNFIKAARTGKETMFLWDNELISSKKLLLNKLLPIAYDGLQKCNIAHEDIDRLLGIIEKRAKGSTGEQWQVRNFRKLQKVYKTNTALQHLTKAMCENQKKALPIHDWQEIVVSEQDKRMNRLVKEVMSTHLFKLYENDFASMARAIMEWNHIHHIPIKNNNGDLSGLLTWSYLEGLDVDLEEVLVKDIMIKEITTVGPYTTIADAQNLMKSTGYGCLPVCDHGSLVGIVSKTDL
ncbi:CBS domain-containing protein [uncultured Croceitalea sp.]|uniref:CBS domain-containing protein n=1 Tax=uncultured Croceitalea sp. TaxID=1798908 RepID=UPI0033066B4C